MKHLICGLLAVSILGLNLGCGSCQAVQQNRDDFLAQSQLNEPDRGHHVLLTIPKDRFEKSVDRAFSAIPNMPVKLKGFGALSRYVGGLSLKPRTLSFDFDRTSNLRLGLDLDAFYGRSKLFGIALKAVIPVVYDRKTKTLTLIVRYDVFRTVTPSLSRGAADNLTRAIRSKIPDIARGLVSTKKIKGYVQTNLNSLLRDFYPFIREKMLKPMGEIVRFTVKVPDLPVERITLISSRDDLVFGIRTSLNARGLSPKVRPLGSENIRFSISTDAIAKLGNKAIADGKIPAKYNEAGTPTSDGSYTAGFAWTGTTNPLKVKLWNLEPKTIPACLYVQAGANPTVSLRGRKLTFGFKDGRIEDVLGPPLISQALNVLGISKRVFTLTKSIALSQKITFGSHAYAVTLDAAEFSGEGLHFDLRIGRRVKKKKRSRRSALPVEPSHQSSISYGQGQSSNARMHSVDSKRRS